MTSYGEACYGEGFYGISPERYGTELPIGIVARVVSAPIATPPPIIDTIAYGLAQRFDYLQQALQVFGLLNKIEYNKGSDLDDIWGKIYDLPRRTGENDIDYRSRLQTYPGVLLGSGTVPNTQAVLDFLIGFPGGTRIDSVWPGRALIDFNSIDAMRAARDNLDLINGILPNLFAAGITCEITLPFQNIYMRSAIRGETEMQHLTRAAIQADMQQTYGMDALISFGSELDAGICATLQATRDLSHLIAAAIRTERYLEVFQRSAILGETGLGCYILAAIRSQLMMTYLQKAAIRATREHQYSQAAAIARTFEMFYGILAKVVFTYVLPIGVISCIQTQRSLETSIRTRIARRYA